MDTIKSFCIGNGGSSNKREYTVHVCHNEPHQYYIFDETDNTTLFYLPRGYEPSDHIQLETMVAVYYHGVNHGEQKIKIGIKNLLDIKI